MSASLVRYLNRYDLIGIYRLHWDTFAAGENRIKQALFWSKAVIKNFVARANSQTCTWPTG